MSEQSHKKLKVYSFLVSKVFPLTNPLGVDILRLMAAYNDLAQVIEWMGDAASTSEDPSAREKSRVRLSFQYRLFLALMHEALDVINEMQGCEEFKRVKALLSDAGRDSLKKILVGSNSIRSQLSTGRKKVAFHYDHEEFSGALKKYTQIFLEKEKAESRFVFSEDGRAYYVLAESLREIVTYAFNTSEDAKRTKDKVGGFLRQVIQLHADLNTFLEETFIAYVKDQKLEDELRLE